MNNIWQSFLLIFAVCFLMTSCTSIQKVTDNNIAVLKQHGIDANLRLRAADVLEKIGKPAVDQLIMALRDDDAFVRREVIEALGKIGDQRAAEPIIVLLQDADEYVRKSAAEALVSLGWKPATIVEEVDFLVAQGKWNDLIKIGTPPVTDYLIVLLKKYNHRGTYLSSRIAAALVDLGWKPSIVSEQVDFLFAQEKWNDLIKKGVPAVEPLIAILANLENKDSSVRWQVAEVLGKIGDPKAIEPLLGFLKENESLVRSRAAIALGEIGDPRATEPLIALLKDNDEFVRAYAAQALGKIRDPRAVEPLIDLLKHNGGINNVFDPDAQDDAAEALGNIGDSRAIEPLIAALTDTQENVRSKATEALGKIGQPALAPLFIALKDNNKLVRMAAATASGEIRDPRAVEPLVSLLTDSDNDVRNNSAEALVRLQWQPATTKEKVDFLIAKNSWTDLIHLGVPAVDSLLAFIKDSAPSVREGVAEALGKIGDPRAIEPLLGLLKDNDRHVQEKAAIALGLMGDKRSIEYLINALIDWDINKEVAETLMHLQWGPSTDTERIHFAVAKREWGALTYPWEITRKILLNDISTGGSLATKNALLAFIGIGKEEIIPDLIKKLDEIGDIRMAEEYLNCGSPELGEAARSWANRHGYSINTGNGAHSVSWNSRR